MFSTTNQKNNTIAPLAKLQAKKNKKNSNIWLCVEIKYLFACDADERHPTVQFSKYHVGNVKYNIDSRPLWCCVDGWIYRIADGYTITKMKYIRQIRTQTCTHIRPFNHSFGILCIFKFFYLSAYLQIV